MNVIYKRNYLKYYFSLFFFFLVHLHCFGSFSENEYDLIKNEIVNYGFENVIVADVDHVLTIAYENRRFRSETEAILEIISIVEKYIGNETIRLVVELRRLPVLMVEVDLYRFKAFKQGIISPQLISESIKTSLDVDEVWKKLKQIEKQNISSFKADMVVNPEFKAQFGKYSDPLESQINLVPELNSHLWTGASFSGQIVIPVQNDLDAEGNTIRPGMISYNQLFRLKDEVLISVAAGAFSNNRAGVDVDMKKYLFNGQLAFGARLGITDYINFTGYNFYYRQENVLLQAFMNVQYHNPEHDLTVKLASGLFLYQDIGFRFDVSRQFGEASIGFFALSTNGELNGGFNFSIPLPPRKYSKLRSLRIRPTDSFYWGYRVKGFPREGIIYSTGQSLDGMMIELNPDYVKNQMIRIIQERSNMKNK